MSKAFLHFALLAALFFGGWFLLGLVDFVGIFEVEQVTEDNEKKLGDFVLETMQRGNEELDSDEVSSCVADMKRRLCSASSIEDTSITIHILVNDDINAFALPGRHLIVYTGLIGYCKSPEELCGVLAHEVAHMEHRHVMKKLVKEVGIAMLATIAGGESSGEIGRQLVTMLSSSAFDREQESEADVSAVHMMAEADIDPEHLANFLFRLSQEKSFPKHLEWLSTHPNSQDRSAEVLKLRKLEKYESRPVIDDATWGKIRKVVASE